MRSNAAEKIVTIAESSATARNAVRDACKELLSRAEFELANMEEGSETDDDRYHVYQVRTACSILDGALSPQSYPEWGQQVKIHLERSGSLAGDLYRMIAPEKPVETKQESDLDRQMAEVQGRDAIAALVGFCGRDPSWVEPLGRACLLLRETMGDVIGHDVFEVVAHRRTLGLLWLDLDEAHHDPERFGDELGVAVAATLGRNPATAVLLLDHLLAASLS